MLETTNEKSEIRIGVRVPYEVDERLNVTFHRPQKGEEEWLTVPRDLLKNIHVHCRGKTRSGKSARVLVRMIQQILQDH